MVNSNIVIETEAEIDFTVLRDKMKRSEKRNPQMVSIALIKKYVNSNFRDIKAGREAYSNLLDLHSKQRDMNIHNYPHLRTVTGAFTHPHSYIYQDGLVSTDTYRIVEMNLIPAFMDVIALISEVDLRPIEEYEPKLNKLYNLLAYFFSGTVPEDSDARLKLVAAMASADIPYLNSYISKCIDLSETQGITVTDLFRINRRFETLHPLEVIVSPIAYSLNTLQYAIMDKLGALYRRGETRFTVIDKYRLYFLVRNDMFERFMSTKVIVDGKQINVKLKYIPTYGM